MTILKVQYLEEIRRITLDKHCISLVELEIKLRYMFPQLRYFTLAFRDDDGNDTVNILSEEDLLLGFAQANARQPPILRIIVSDVNTTTTTTTTEKIVVKLEDNGPSESVEIEEEGTTNAFSEDESAFCSHCIQKFVYGAARFKCINCLDIVLCEECEAKCVHNPIHLLVKLRSPDLSLKQQLIFTSHIEDSKERAAAKNKKKEIRKAMKEEKIQEMKKKEERIKSRKERLRRRNLARKKLEETKRDKRRIKKEKKQIGIAVADVVPTVELESAVLLNNIPSVEPTSVDAAGVLTQSILASLEELIPSPVAQEIEGTSAAVVEETVVPIEEASGDQPKEIVPQTEPEPSTNDGTENTEPWSIYNMISSFRLLPARDENTQQVNISDYRIAGIAFRQKLDELERMGFTDRNRNIVVLVKHLSNLERAVEELVSS